MATPPVVRTFSAGEVETAAYLNALGSVVSFLLNPPRCKVSQSAAQTLTTAVWAAVTFDAETYDTDNMHSTVSNTSRLSATTSGLYSTLFVVAIGTSATNIREIECRKNAAGSISGGSVIDGLTTNTSVGSGAGSVLTWQSDVQMSAGDYLEVFAFQNSGGNLSILTGGGFGTWGQMRLVASS